VATQTRVVLTDDLNGGEAEGTVQFGLDGQGYEMELDAANSAALRASLRPYIDAGRRVAIPAQRRRGTRSAPGRAAVPAAKFATGQPLTDDERAKIRAWAKTQPHLGTIADRGRLGANVIAEYRKAH
jgi:hypothetical protein